jgi:hypothetical protein
MKASELVKMISGMIEEHGDLEIGIVNFEDELTDNIRCLVGARNDTTYFVLSGASIYITKCNSCNKDAIHFWVPDPYLSQLFPEKENEPRHWCGKCFQDRLDEI